MTRRRRHLKHEGICQSLLMGICCSCLGRIINVPSSLSLFSSFSHRIFFCSTSVFPSKPMMFSFHHRSLVRWIIQLFIFSPRPTREFSFLLLFFFLFACFKLKNITAMIFQSLIFIWLRPFLFPSPHERFFFFFSLCLRFESNEFLKRLCIFSLLWALFYKLQIVITIQKIFNLSPEIHINF